MPQKLLLELTTDKTNIILGQGFHWEDAELLNQGNVGFYVMRLEQFLAQPATS